MSLIFEHVAVVADLISVEDCTNNKSYSHTLIKLPAPSPVPASLSGKGAGKPLLTGEGVLATMGVSWPG